MILFDKDAKKITLIEGTVYAPDIILTREDEKQQKYGEMRKSLEKMYPEYNVDHRLTSFLTSLHVTASNFTQRWKN